MEQEIRQLKKRLENLEQQQLFVPLDVNSDLIIKDAVIKARDVSTTRQEEIALTGEAQNIDVFKTPDGYRKMQDRLGDFWVPFFNV